MKPNKIVAVFLCAVLLVCCAQYTRSADDNIKVRLNGEPVTLSSAPHWYGSGLKDGLYVPLLSFCDHLGASVSEWDGDTGTALAGFSGFSLTATADDIYLTANDRCLYVPYGCLKSHNDLLVPIGALSAALGATYRFDSERLTLYVTAGPERPQTGPDYYDGTDLYWLAHIINAEACSESFLGKVAVGNVVMNRVKTSGFPNTVYDVIFDRSGGVQFEPTLNGTVYNDPSEDCYTAAKLALEGAAPVNDCLFFASILDCWAAENRPYYTTIGGHHFFQ